MIDKPLQERVDAGARIKNLLADPIVQEWFRDMRDELDRELLAAVTPDARTNVWAKAVALAAFSTRMKGVMDDGEGIRQATLANARTAGPVTA